MAEVFPGGHRAAVVSGGRDTRRADFRGRARMLQRASEAVRCASPFPTT